MIRQIREKLRRIVGSLALTGACVFTAVPLGDCNGYPAGIRQDPEPTTPVIPLPPPGQWAANYCEGTPVPFPIP